MTLTRDRKSELLAGARLFDGVDADGMERIAAVAVQVDFPADHVIARQGEIGTGFFVVVDGAVRVVRDGETIATLGPGDFFGELSVLDGKPRNASVVADGPTTLPRPPDVGLRGRPARGAKRRHRDPARAGRPPARSDRSRPALTAVRVPQG